MLALGELLIETPEDLHNAESGRGDGLREVTTRRRDGTDDGDRALARGVTEAASLTSTLVERGETGGQVSGIAGVGGHFSETTRDLTQGLGPTGSRVGHHGNVHALVTEVLGESNTSVDGGLTGSDGHVGGVGDQAGALHDVVLLAANVDGQLGELHEYFGHLVTALTATDVDDAVRVGVLGERLRNDSLTATEGAGNGAGSTLDDTNNRRGQRPTKISRDHHDGTGKGRQGHADQ